MKEKVSRMDDLKAEWQRKRTQIETARKHPLGFIWLGWLEMTLEKVIQRYNDEQAYIEDEYKKKHSGHSGSHG